MKSVSTDSTVLPGLTGDSTYTVTVEASTGAGRGPVVSESIYLPAGACTSNAC